MYDRDRILHSIDLAALADDVLGGHHGSERSPTWPCPDPNHAQTGRTPPVTIFRSNAGDERWHCHGCGAGGTAIDLVIATQHVDVRDALEILAARAGVTEDGRPLRKPHRRPVRRPAPDRVVDAEGLATYVEDCARRLWTPEGRPVRHWLTNARGLPDDVLHHNMIGADPGSSQPRPAGMPAARWAAVLPVHRNGEPVFAQLRVLGSGRLRYLNAASTLAPNPRIASYEPPERHGSCIVVTEGVIDALSATAAGLRGVALLGASVPDPSRPSAASAELIERLAGMDGRLVLALDADDAGQRATHRLHELLADRRPDTVRVSPPPGVNDLNDWMRLAGDHWPEQLTGEVRLAIDSARSTSLVR